MRSAADHASLSGCDLIVEAVFEDAGVKAEVTASVLKRTLVRKDPTFSEADYGFRAFGELLRHLADRNVIELSEGPAKGDPEILLPETGDKEEAFALLHQEAAPRTNKSIRVHERHDNRQGEALRTLFRW